MVSYLSAAVLLASSLVGSGQSEDLPRVLILGDSISIGYTPIVQELLDGEAVVVRPSRENGRPENCQGTTYGLTQIERWLKLGGGNWDVIHLNFGLHDLKRVDPETRTNSNRPEDPPQANLATYSQQLTAIVDTLETTGARLIFATTTPVPPGGVRPYRGVEDPQRYNAVALRIMRERGITINDLYQFAITRLDEIQQPVNVHFTKDGSRLLGQQVASSIRQALAKNWVK